jgi:hypothetical protein
MMEGGIRLEMNVKSRNQELVKKFFHKAKTFHALDHQQGPTSGFSCLERLCGARLELALIRMLLLR